jgi:pyruvate kinase
MAPPPVAFEIIVSRALWDRKRAGLLGEGDCAILPVEANMAGNGAGAQWGRTKIVCTIGPASEDEATLEGLVKAGMDVVRLNFAHGDHPSFARVIERIRRVSERLGQPVSILQDLPGPKMRTGPVEGDMVPLKRDSTFDLVGHDVPGSEKRVSISYPGLADDVGPQDHIFLDDGAVQLEVLETTGDVVRTRVLNDGFLKPEKGINVPGVRLNVPSVTDKDLRHLEFGLNQAVDYVAVSFVREASDVQIVRDAAGDAGGGHFVIAKIEKHEALDHLEEIIEASDAVMIARGDLGVETPLSQVPLVQKRIIRECNAANKPVITATQMLESMVENPRPTRAEVTDVANAILDGTDAVMLSGETAIGEHPVKAVQIMSRIAASTESQIPFASLLEEHHDAAGEDVPTAVALAACRMAQALEARLIIAPTRTGSTAQLISHFRPRAPVVALTMGEETRRRLALSWGVLPLIGPSFRHTGEMLAYVRQRLKEEGLAEKGDRIIVTGGAPLGEPGSTDFVRAVTL